MKNIYAIYVDDPNGWENGCEDYETVFFGYPSEGWETYVHPQECGIGRCGHVTVTGYNKAIAVLRGLEHSGDWTPADGSEACRPIYAMQIWERKR